MPASTKTGTYVPRQTQDCDAAVLMRQHLPGFLARLEESGHAPLPKFVQAKLEGVGWCGDFTKTAVLAQVHKATVGAATEDLDLDPTLCRYLLRPPCRKCGGRMRVVEVVSDPDHIARILHGTRTPPRPHPPGQLLLFAG